MGNAGGQGDDGVDALALHAVFGLDAFLGDVAEHRHAAGAFGALLLTDAREVEIQQARLGVTDLELAGERADGLGEFKGQRDVGRKAAQLGAIDVFLAHAQQADRGGISVFNGTVMREDEHAFAKRVQDRLHEVTLALEAAGEDCQILRVEVINAAQHAIKRTEAATGHIRKRAPRRGER